MRRQFLWLLAERQVFTDLTILDFQDIKCGGTFNYDLNAQPELNSALAGAAWVMPTALFLMFIGGAGKSAMFPLKVVSMPSVGNMKMLMDVVR